MGISINFGNLTKSYVSKMHLLFSLRCRQGLGTKAKTDMHEELCSSPQPAWSRSYVVFYAPALACRLRLALDHISDF